MMASPVNEAVFIDILYFGISVYYLVQIGRNIFRVCFDFDAKASQLVIDFVQQRCDFGKQAVSGLFCCFAPYPTVFIGISLKF